MKITQFSSFRALKILIVLFCIVGQAHAQFRSVLGGVSLSSSGISIHGSYARAGGGVVLHGEANPSPNCIDCNITGVTVTTNAEQATLTITSGDNKATYSAPFWLVKDAVNLVKSETQDIYRNVNLLGKPTDVEIADGKDGSDGTNYWHVELSDVLRGTKSGETLLVVDLIQTDPEFYSRYDLNYYSASNVDHILTNGSGLSPTNDLDITSSPDISLTDSPNQNSNGLEAYMTRIQQMKGYENWTWADEDTGYTFLLDWKAQRLFFTGRPQFMYLKEDGNNTTNQLRYSIIWLERVVLKRLAGSINHFTEAVGSFNEATNDLEEATNLLSHAMDQLDQATNLLEETASFLSAATNRVSVSTNNENFLFNLEYATLERDFSDFPTNPETDVTRLTDGATNQLAAALDLFGVVNSQLTAASNLLASITGGSQDAFLTEAEVPTEYFKAYTGYIDALNPQLFSKAVEFSQLAAFFRHLKMHQTVAWGQICSAATGLPPSVGMTPRLIFHNVPKSSE